MAEFRDNVVALPGAAPIDIGQLASEAFRSVGSDQQAPPHPTMPTMEAPRPQSAVTSDTALAPARGVWEAAKAREQDLVEQYAQQSQLEDHYRQQIAEADFRKRTAHGRLIRRILSGTLVGGLGGAIAWVIFFRGR